MLAELTHTWGRGRNREKNGPSSDAEGDWRRSPSAGHPALPPGLHGWGSGRLSYCLAHIHSGERWTPHPTDARLDRRLALANGT